MVREDEAQKLVSRGQTTKQIKDVPGYNRVDNKYTMSYAHADINLSQETLASLQQLDPSPIESPLVERDEKELIDPSPSPPKRAATLGLSGSHGQGYYCNLDTE